MLKTRDRRGLTGRVRLKPPAGLRVGFSLIEILVVTAILAILMLMAVPAMTSLIPHYLVRSSAKSLDNMMQRARLLAYNTQKPIRVVVDCRDRTSSAPLVPCSMRLYSANFNNAGELDVTGPDGAWTEVSQSRREIPREVKLTLSADASTIDGLYWAVFLPTGRVKASHDPMRLTFGPAAGQARKVEVGLSLFSGRVTVRRP